MIAVPVDEGIDNEALSIDEPALDKKKETGNWLEFDRVFLPVTRERCFSYPNEKFVLRPKYSVHC